MRLLSAALHVALWACAALGQAPDDSAAWADPSRPIFLRDEPGFADSATVVRELNRTLQRCGGCDNVTRLYSAPERVLVYHWNSMTLNGLGNTLGYFHIILSTAVSHGRAGFSSRNAPRCGPYPVRCRFNPALYFCGRSGFSWDWSAATEGAVRAAMASRGHAESVFVVANDSVALVNNATGERLEGKHTLASFLAHPSVAHLPWVSLHLPPEPEVHAANSLWTATDAERAPGDLWAFMVGGGPTNDAWGKTRASLGGDSFCWTSTFMAATPMLQRELLPHLRRLDAVRAAGGGAVGVHVRSGFADFSSGGGALTHAAKNLSTPASELVVKRTHAFRWGELDVLSETCPVDPRVAAKYGVVKPPVCLTWNNATRAVFESRGAVCAAAPGAPAPPPPAPPASNATEALVLPANASNATADAQMVLAEHEFGEENGTYSTLAACAVHAARGLWRQSNTTSGASKEKAFLIFVAGDLPPLYQLLKIHPTVGVNVDSAEGALGHVSSGEVCSGTANSSHVKVCNEHSWNPGDAWTRAMVDAWMLGSVDLLLRFGGTSFMNVVHARVAWPLPQRELVGEMQPERNWTLFREYSMIQHSLVDLLSRELEDDELVSGNSSSGRRS